MGKFREYRERLAEAEAITRDLEDITTRDASLVSSTKATLTKAKESLILQKMAELPIENMRDATDSPLRIETLQKFGITTVAGVYHASEEKLARISGISTESAAELKSIADRIFEAISESMSYGVKLDSLTVADLDLLENLQDLEGIRSRLRGNHKKLEPLVHSLRESLSSAKPLRSRLTWILAGSERRSRALDAISNVAYIMGEPTTGMLASLARDALLHLESTIEKSAVEDFQKRSSDYYSTLEQVTGTKPQIGQHHLNDELIQKIESEVVDTSAIKATLRGYQLFGAKFALTQNRVILGDEMGLGKTMQALAFLSERKARGATRFLVVCPASVLVNWEREIATRSELRYITIHGEGQKNELAAWREQGGIGLTTFDTLKNFGLTDDEIAHLQVDTVVVDEAHNVKNLETGRAKTIVRWLDRSPNVLFMTGTPLENRVSEFINLASLLDQKFAKGLNKAAMVAGAEAFRNHVAPIYLRRNAREVLNELPELIEVDEYCTWEGADRVGYLEAVVQGNFMRMRQCGMNPADTSLQSNKLQRLVELVEQSFEDGEKVLVFSYFRETLHLVAQALGERALGPITGATPSAQRQTLVDAFSSTPEPKSLIGQVQAAGTGLNIQAASVVILCEPQIKPSLEVQAIARAHRMGQVRPVRVHRLILSDSVDEILVEMLARKSQEFDLFARESELANQSPLAKDKSESEVLQYLLKGERDRLTLSGELPKL